MLIRGEEYKNKYIQSFSLVELLIVIAVLIIMAGALVVVISPGELLAQARDSNRMSELNSLNKAITMHANYAIGAFRGDPNVVYTSLLSTSLNCADLSLPALPAGWSYRCVTTEANLRRIDGSGWLPINFNAIPGGSPFIQLPIDPINSAASTLYFAYTRGSGGYAAVALLESARHGRSALQDGGNDAGRYEVGTDLLLWSRASGLVGYWPFTGAGAVANNQTIGMEDASGNNNHGRASNANATGMAFTTGQVGGAISFDGVDDFVTVGNASILQTPAGTTFTYEAWIRGLPGQVPNQMFINRFLPYFRVEAGRLHLSIRAAGSQRNVWGLTLLSSDRWHHVVATFDATGMMRVFLNGVLDGTAGPFLPIDNQGDAMRFGIHGAPPGSLFYRGILDEVRIYNRALSASEIRANFNAGR